MNETATRGRELLTQPNLMRRSKRPTRYVLYNRCSTDDQAAGDYTTIDAQIAHNTNYAENKIAETGGVIVGTYQDDGKTGTNLKRDDWKRLLRDAERREFDVVVITYMSRLGRGNTYHVAEYLLGEQKVSVEMVQEKFTEDLNGQLNKDFKILIDGQYVKQVSEWTKTKQTGMVANGYCTGGTRPFGYMSETVPGMAPTMLGGGKVKPAPRRRIPHPEEAGFVLRAFEIFTETDNMGSVQRYLREVDASRCWSMESVRRLLINDVVRGVQRFGRNINYTAHEAIVPEYLWDRAQERIAARAAKGLVIGNLDRCEGRDLGYRIENKVDTFAYLLRGHVHCTVCGNRMSPSSHHGATSKVRYYECKCNRVNASALHDTVLGEIVTCATHPTRLSLHIAEAVRQLPAPHDIKEESRKLKRNRQNGERSIACLVASLQEIGTGSTVARKEITNQIREIESRIVEIDRKARELEAEAVNVVGKRPDAKEISLYWSRLTLRWDKFTDAEKAEFLSCLVERVEFGKQDNGICPVTGRQESVNKKGILHLIMQNSLSGCVNFTPDGCGSRVNSPYPLPSLANPTRIVPRSIPVPITLKQGHQRKERRPYQRKPKSTEEVISCG